MAWSRRPSVETVEPWKPQAVSENKSYGLDELLCKIVELDTNTFRPICDTMIFYSWSTERSQEKFYLTLGWCVWQDQEIFFNMAQAAMNFNF